MGYFKALSVRGKIIFTVFIVLAMELVVCLSSAWFLHAVDTRMTRIVDVETQRIILAGRVNSELLELHRAQKNLMLSINSGQMERFRRHSIQYRSAIQVSISRLSDLAGTEAERDAIKRFGGLLEEFLDVNDKIDQLTQQDWEANPDPLKREFGGILINKKAVDLSTGPGRAAYDEAAALLANIIKSTEATLAQAASQSHSYVLLAMLVMAGLSVGSIVSGLLVGTFAARSISHNLNSLVSVTDSIAQGKLDVPVAVNSGDETGLLAGSIGVMQSALLDARHAAEARDWLNTGITRINDAMRGRNDVPELCRHTVSEMASYLGAGVGSLFLMQEAGGACSLELMGGYACSHLQKSQQSFEPGTGLIGQAALDGRQIVLTDVPQDYVKVCSSLGDCCPTCLVVTPILFEEKVTGVLELGFTENPSELHLDYLKQVMPGIAINVETVKGREELGRALQRAQTLYEELQQQEEEIRAANEELEEKAELLNRSNERLKNQQEELEELNQELEGNNQTLQLQKKAVELANLELVDARSQVEEKASQLEVASRYKSEFLANMSHELRTPLNSMLLLSRILSENTEANLTEDQVRSARIINSSGKDLLSLINEVLDLARIEAGRMEIATDRIAVEDLAASLAGSFRPMAEEKGLYLRTETGPGCPDQFVSDRRRVEQILRNLLSNAVKFTNRGGVTLSFGSRPGNIIAVSVRDTGIGIPRDKREVVFDAFQQIDSGVSRRYGGTGLGLSISRELAHLLGGCIELESDEGDGATFALLIPVEPDARVEDTLPTDKPRPVEAQPPGTGATPIPAGHPSDDREGLAECDKSLLIIEDDPHFSEFLGTLCRKKGFKCLQALTGEEGLELARAHRPKGVILDIRLPGKDGWSVLQSLKDDPRTRHIPVHIMSVEDASAGAIGKGAVGFLNKPARLEDIEEALRRIEDGFSRRVKDLLIVEDDENLRASVEKLIGNGDVRTTGAGTAGEALKALREKDWDCMILDIGLPDMSGLELLRQISLKRGDRLPPTIIYTGRELSAEEEAELRAHSWPVVPKGGKSAERLLDEVSLFLHRVVEDMPPEKRKLITDLHDYDLVFRGKKILIVDDDMRNLFALSRVLQEKGVVTLKAEDGRMALGTLGDHPDVDLVLMDIMMPVMDGCECMKLIRQQERFSKLPIIALTAKAMKQDRERCIEAGASDYLSKPVDMERLFSMMRVWLYS